MRYFAVLILCFLSLSVRSQSQITEIEYFINTDPGVGSASRISVTPGSEVDISPIFATSALSTSFYTVHVRAKDADGNWGFYETRTFVVRVSGSFQTPDPVEVAEMELFFDEDPGLGNAISLSAFSPSLIVDINDLIPNNISAGWHTVGVRAKDVSGNWGLAEFRRIYVNNAAGTTPVVSKITQLEYYYGDEDPGLGNGTSIAINPVADSIDLELDLPSPSDLPIGTNSITIRAQNEDGLWGFPESSEFEVSDDCVTPVSDFEIELACAGETVNFTDLSTNVLETATYRWYLDGDDEVDDTTNGDVSFIYNTPGSYNVALVIDQGETCVDSTAFTLEIKAKPIVVFNADRVDAGETTVFDVVQFFVEPSAIWSWDFETDGEIDENTAGSTTHLYPGVGEYIATVMVENGEGCEGSFSRAVRVSSAGTGGGSGPRAIFSALPGCAGEATQFNDLSVDIPDGSTYAWDFNNDGTIDNTTIGNTNFSYDSPGNYTSILTITLPDASTVMFSEIVPVQFIPVASFNATTVCIGQTTVFTNTSDQVDESTQYNWDLDGDNTVDSNGSGPVEFTFEAPGQYSALLTVDNGNGCFDQAVQTITVIAMPEADFTAGSACVGEEVTFLDNSTGLGAMATYAWDFDGDGTTDSETKGNSFFTYTTSGDYTATLTVDNGFGCISTISKSINFRAAAEPDFNASTVCLGETTTFTDASENVDAEAIYNWDFDGDGNVDSESPEGGSFAFTTAGSYRASLLISSGNCPARIEKTIFVNALPTPELDSDIPICTSEEVVLDPGTFAAYEWSDGSENPTLTVREAGSYSVTVTNEAGCTASAESIVSIEQEVSSSFSYTVRPGDFSTVIDFENVSPNATSYLWDFGDGNTSTEASPSHEYTDIDPFFGSIFNVCLTAFNTCNSDQYCELIGLIITGSVDKQHNQMVKVYPNPAETILTLGWPEKGSAANVQITDLQGKEILKKMVEENELELFIGNISPGQYLISVNHNDFSYQEILIIK
ncbi:MAG: PKD domain-containing protein [Bacteroidota bacterium]